jgi:hypothetical protein
VTTPKMATPRKSAIITSMIVFKKAGISGVGREPTRARLSRTRERPNIARTLPTIATTAAATTELEAEELEHIDTSDAFISLLDLARNSGATNTIPAPAQKKPGAARRFLICVVCPGGLGSRSGQARRGKGLNGTGFVALHHEHFI